MLYLFPKTKELEGSKKRAWFWQYYTSIVLDTTWERGKKGRKSITVQDEHHICNVNSDCRFQRFARNLHSSTTALKDHIEIDHKIFESTDPKSAYTANPILLTKWIETAEDQPSFEEALLDWIVYTCQPFTVTETKWFKRMMKAASSICALRIFAFSGVQGSF